MKKGNHYSWLIAGLIVLSACGGQPAASPTAAPTALQAGPTAVPASPTPEVAEPAESNIFGPGTFILALPEGWDVLGPERITSDAARPYDAWLLGENPSSGGPGTSRVAILNASQWTAEEFVLSMCTTCEENPFEEVTLGGLPARRTEVGGGDVPVKVTWTFVVHNGNLIGLAIHDPQTLEPLEEVLATVRFQ